MHVELFFWVKRNATILNHNIVKITIVLDMTIWFTSEICAGITVVNNHKKNTVALGFSALVKKPILIAVSGDISCCSSLATIVWSDFFDRNALIHKNIRYPAPHSLMILKRRIDWDTMRAIPRKQ